MNKNNLILTGMLTVFCILSAKLPAQNPSIIIRTDTEENVIGDHTGTGAGDKVTISQRNSANAGELLQWREPNTLCFQTYPENTEGVYFYNQSGPSYVNNYPYLQIENTGSNKLTYMEITGMVGTSSDDLSYLPYGFGTDGTNFSATTASPFDMPFLILDDNSGCATAYITDFFNPVTKIPIPDGTKYIRLAAANKGFDPGSSAIPENYIPSYVFEISLWTEDDGVPSSINGSDAESFSANWQYGALNFTEEASDVRIYEVSGLLVTHAVKVRNLSLNTLPGGVYIVKATNAEGEMMTMKIIR
ncbi:MAG: hypothetical protein FWF54_05860 [Candidatus Azobacteroides sp.]|nr:hypothetical protein [Candidatus Azobacteroides sp.]